MEKFTKGPWKRDSLFMQDDAKVRVALPDFYGMPNDTVCECWHGCDGIDVIRAEANAALIAAAPEMYELLAKLSGMLTDINAHAVVNEIEKLLAKSRGE